MSIRSVKVLDSEGQKGALVIEDRDGPTAPLYFFFAGGQSLKKQ